MFKDDRQIWALAVFLFFFTVMLFSVEVWHNEYVEQRLVASGFCQAYTPQGGRIWVKCNVEAGK